MEKGVREACLQQYFVLRSESSAFSSGAGVASSGEAVWPAVNSTKTASASASRHETRGAPVQSSRERRRMEQSSLPVRVRLYNEKEDTQGDWGRKMSLDVGMGEGGWTKWQEGWRKSGGSVEGGAGWVDDG